MEIIWTLRWGELLLWNVLPVKRSSLKVVRDIVHYNSANATRWAPGVVSFLLHQSVLMWMNERWHTCNWWDKTWEREWRANMERENDTSWLTLSRSYIHIHTVGSWSCLDKYGIWCWTPKLLPFLDPFLSGVTFSMTLHFFPICKIEWKLVTASTS